MLASMRVHRAMTVSEVLEKAFIRRAVTVLLLVAPCYAQSGLWTEVKGYKPTPLQPAMLSQAQRQLIAKSIAVHERTATQDWGQDCTVSELSEGSKWELLPVSPLHKVLLVEAGPCARGGQGSNGAMWIVRWDGATPVVLASPKQKFSGWIYSVQPSTRHGYRDIVLGWHMSAFEASLSYFRFDGSKYRCIGNATSATDESGIAKIVPGQTSAR